MSCKQKPPVLYISLREEGIHNGSIILHWIVENRSDKTVKFDKGSIMNYEIQRHGTGQKITGKGDDTENITLKQGDIYDKTIVTPELTKGHYSATFWAEYDENTRYTMSISFDID
jgi:hypothetical protein